MLIWTFGMPRRQDEEDEGELWQGNAVKNELDYECWKKLTVQDHGSPFNVHHRGHHPIVQVVDGGGITGKHKSVTWMFIIFLHKSVQSPTTRDHVDFLCHVCYLFFLFLTTTSTAPQPYLNRYHHDKDEGLETYLRLEPLVCFSLSFILFYSMFIYKIVSTCLQNNDEDNGSSKFFLIFFQYFY